MNRWMVALTVLGISCAPMAALAGSSYEVACKNPECGFKTEVSFGGSRLMGQITGYCVGCKKFVCITYERAEKPPEPASTVWDAASGHLLELYSCPDCHNPFAAITSEEALTHCPHCGADKLVKKLLLMFD